MRLNVEILKQNMRTRSLLEKITYESLTEDQSALRSIHSIHFEEASCMIIILNFRVIIHITVHVTAIKYF